MQAIYHDLLWLVAALNFLCLVVFGIVLAWSACRRAKSAYGDGGKGWMAIIPLVNLVLHFKPPQVTGQDDESLAAAAPHPALNVLGTLFGLFLLVLGNGLPNLMLPFIEAKTQRDAVRPEIANAVLDLRLRAGQLESVLRQAAAGVFETRIDEVTVLLGARAAGTTLTYDYRLDSGVQQLERSFGGMIARNSCGDAGVMKLLAAGATLDFSFAYVDGHPGSEFSLTLADCPAS